jgi:hypothetical protein
LNRHNDSGPSAQSLAIPAVSCRYLPEQDDPRPLYVEAESVAVQRVKDLMAEIAGLSVEYGMARCLDGQGGWLFGEMVNALAGQIQWDDSDTPQRATTKKRPKEPCTWCGSNEEPNWDHIIPRSRRGSNRPSNRRWLSGPCNRFKNNRLDDEIPAGELAEFVGRRRLPAEVAR